MRLLRFQPSAANVPPFWLRPDEPLADHIHPDVCRELRRLWPWAYRRVESLLHDAPRAAELVEAVAIDASRQLHANPGVARNLTGYLITAFHHRVLREMNRDRRISYEGLMSELEAKRLLIAPNWLIPLERKILVGEIVASMPLDAKRVAHYRLLDFTWEEIGTAMNVESSQARNKFYYGLRAAWQRLTQDLGPSGRREQNDEQR